VRDPVVCSLSAGGQTSFIEALVDVFGFVAVPLEELEPYLRQGRRVLVNGWWSCYERLVRDYPGRIAVVWHSGWAGSDLMGEGQTLATALQHLREGRIDLLWLEQRDVLPPGAFVLPSVWSPRMLERLVEPPRPLREPGAVVAGLHGDYPSGTKNILATVVGCVAAGAKVHLGRASMNGARGLALAEVLAGKPHEVHETLPRRSVARLLASVDLLVHPSFSETWSIMVMEAVYVGTPAVISDVIAWSAKLPLRAQEACIVRPAKASERVASLVRRLLDDGEERKQLLRYQRACLDGLATSLAAGTARTLFGLGFPVRVVACCAP